MIFQNIFAIVSYNINQILNYNFFGNIIKDYLISLVVFVLAFLFLKVFKKTIVSKIKKIAQKTKNDFDDLLVKIIESIGGFFYFFASLEAALWFIVLPDLLEKAVFYLFLITVIYYFAKAAGAMIDYVIKKAVKKTEEDDHIGFDPSAVKILGRVIKGVIWIIAVILLLQNFGYDVSSLVVGLGVGGVAIGFALQNILEDIFSSFSIYFDKPFKTGDFIIIGKDMGVVKHIGIKTTRIQALEGQELVVPNRELTGIRINNYKKMNKRRVVFPIGIIYDTPADKLRKVPAIIKEVMSKIEELEIDRVHFKSFGDFSLNFEIVYYLDTADYNEYMNVQQEINIGIKEALEKEGIEFAYPTQTIYLNK